MNDLNLETYQMVFGSTCPFTKQPVERTKQDHPYAYDTFTTADLRTDEDTNLSSVYTDRLMSWDWMKYNDCCEEVWDNHGQYFDQRSFESIEKFLQLYFDNDKLVLKLTAEGCNAASGYSVWYFEFDKGE